MGGCFSVSLSLDSLFKPCVDCVAVKAAYVCQFEENLRALKKSRDELDAQKDDVVREVTKQEVPGMERLAVVRAWCNKVDALLTEVDKVLEVDAPQESRRLCLGGCCSWNYMSSYKFAKGVAGKLKEVEDEKKKGVFDKLVDRAPPKPVVERNVGSTVGMEALLVDAWNKIMQKGVDTIGIYGMGGVGKTTLLNHINNKLEGVIPKDFDVVIFVTVSKDYKKENVQESIWKSLGFNVERLKMKSHEEKVKEIYNLLRRKKFVLLLDDVWKPINLADDIGVPETRDGSKVVFTTRLEDVCGQMEAQERIKLERLKWPEDWELFQRKVGEDTLKSHQAIPALAEAVVKECGGLPIAIITVARAMAVKRTLQEWESALESLKNSTSKFSGMEEEVLSRLKFSYDSLPNDTKDDGLDHKSSFLYCCLFPEDYKIPKSDLVEYWICENFCKTVNKGYDVLGTLVRACLLEDGGEWVKMHDVVRDMALWLVGDCDENFLVKAGQQLTEAPPVESWGGKRRISLMRNEIQSIMEVPTCPGLLNGLLTLLLRQNRSLTHISGGLFQSMSDLKTLDLSRTSIVELPPEISRLVSLEYLNVANTALRKLPVELKMLDKLKYLNLEATFELEMIPRQVISSLSLLQVLRFAYSGLFVEVEKVEGDGNWLGSDEMVKDLECLKFLNVLTVTIRFLSDLHSLSKNTKLSSCIQILHLRNVRGSKSINVSSFPIMEQLEEFGIINCHDLEELKSSEEVLKGLGEKRTFNKLRRVRVWNCSCLSELTWLALAPNLIDVDVRGCDEMKEIINAEKLKEISSDMGLFEKLRLIRLHKNPQLESIYLNPLCFPDLKEIEILRCRALKKLPLNSESAKGRQLKIIGEKHWWDRLEWEDDAAKSAFIKDLFETV